MLGSIRNLNHYLAIYLNIRSRASAINRRLDGCLFCQIFPIFSDSIAVVSGNASMIRFRTLYSNGRVQFTSTHGIGVNRFLLSDLRQLVGVRIRIFLGLLARGFPSLATTPSLIILLLSILLKLIHPKPPTKE